MATNTFEWSKRVLNVIFPRFRGDILSPWSLFHGSGILIHLKRICCFFGDMEPLPPVCPGCRVVNWAPPVAHLMSRLKEPIFWGAVAHTCILLPRQK